MEEIGESVTMPVEDRSEAGAVSELKEEPAEVEQEVVRGGDKPVVGGETRSEASAEWGVEASANGDVPVSRRVITFYLVKVPRPIEIVEIKNQISNKFNEMNAIDVILNRVSQERRDVLSKLEEPRGLLKSWRQELKVKFNESKSFKEEMSSLRDDSDVCRSEEDLDAKIARLEGDLQHNTYSLKDEKAIVKKIQALKASRSKVISNSDARQKRDSIKETSILPLDEQIKELKARIAKAVKETEDDEEKASSLTSQVKALLDKKSTIKAEIDDLKSDLQSVNTDDHAKYTRTFQEAAKLATEKDTDSLQNLCTQQMEELMHLWNADRSFRSDYIKNNLPSTLRRLGTSDGRSHVPGDPSEKSIPDKSAPVEEVKVEKPREEPAKLRKEEKDHKSKEEKSKKDKDVVKPKKESSKKLKAEFPKKLDGKYADAEAEVVETLEHIEEPREPEVDEETRLESERQKRREEEIEKAKAAEARKKRKEEKKRAQLEAYLEKERLRKQAEKEKKLKKKSGAENASNESENGGGEPGIIENGTDHAEPESVEAVVHSRGRKQAVQKSKPSAKPLRRKKRTLQHQLYDAFYTNWQMVVMVLAAVVLLLVGSSIMVYVM